MSPLLSDVTTCLTTTSDTPALDASVLLAHIIGKPRTWVIAHPELTLTTEQKHHLDNALDQLQKGKPFPYVLGRWEFFGLEFEVTPDVLIPRPETELLVEKAIAWLNKHPGRRSIADVGTGSGIIAVSLAFNVPNVYIIGTDISPKALDVARRNAEKHGVMDRIQFSEADLLPLSSFILHPSSLDLLCANLPYVPSEILRNLPIFGREPTLALDGGPGGLVLIQRLMQISPSYLAPHSLILLEIEATLGAQALELSHRMFPTAYIQLHKDLTNRDRLLEIQT